MNTPDTDLSRAIDRLTHALEQITGKLDTTVPVFTDSALAYRWQRHAGWHKNATLVPINEPLLIDFAALKNIDLQAHSLRDNTHQFVLGLPANNVLMTGARGTGKSSLVRACLAQFHSQGLRLIEVEKNHLEDLPSIVDLVRHQPQKFIIFCDDLSFEEGEHSYKGLKTVLDGSLAGPSANILIYATSNRKHMITERMSDNLETAPDGEGEIHPGDTIEEKISLSERFGLHLNFYSFSQPQYLAAVDHWLAHYAITLEDTAAVHQLAIRWATQRGSRSGRVAMQFARDYAGKQQLQQLSPSR